MEQSGKPLQAQRQEVRLFRRVYETEDRLLQQSDIPDRDAVAARVAIKLAEDPDASLRDQRNGLKLLELVNRRLDARDKWVSEQITERLKIQATLAANSSARWQPNGPPPDPDSELQKLIDGAGSDQEGDGGDSQ